MSAYGPPAVFLLIPLRAFGFAQCAAFACRFLWFQAHVAQSFLYLNLLDFAISPQSALMWVLEMADLSAISKHKREERGEEEGEGHKKEEGPQKFASFS